MQKEGLPAKAKVQCMYYNVSLSFNTVQVTITVLSQASPPDNTMVFAHLITKLGKTRAFYDSELCVLLPTWMTDLCLEGQCTTVGSV